MPETLWADYVLRIAGEVTDAEIAREIGIHRSVVGSWRRGGGVEAATAVRFARAYNANVLEALAAAGFIDGGEVDLVQVHVGLEAYSDVEMLQELLRRAKGDVGGGRNDVEIDELTLAADTQNETPDEDTRTP